MFTATVYNIMLGAPSDIKEEIEMAKNILTEWNCINSYTQKIVLLPLHWSFSSYPVLGKHPQKILDKQVVAKSDLLVCLFGARIGTPTDTEDSGSIEEIKEHIKAGKHVMLFFKTSIENLSNLDLKQFKKLQDFKQTIGDKCLYSEFNTADTFKQLFREKLQAFINDNWLTTSRLLEQPQSNIYLSDEEIEILRVWCNSNDDDSSIIRYIGNSATIIIGKKYDVQNAREMAEWEDFFKRLNEMGFVSIKRYDKSDNPIYKLQKAAYDYIDSIEL